MINSDQNRYRKRENLHEDGRHNGPCEAFRVCRNIRNAPSRIHVGPVLRI